MKFWNVTYKLAFTGPPYHAALMFKMPDGEFRLLESGPNDTTNVRLCVLPNRLQSWKGLIHVRRRLVPLTPEVIGPANDLRTAPGRQALPVASSCRSSHSTASAHALEDHGPEQVRWRMFQLQLCVDRAGSLRSRGAAR